MRPAARRRGPSGTPASTSNPARYHAKKDSNMTVHPLARRFQPEDLCYQRGTHERTAVLQVSVSGKRVMVENAAGERFEVTSADIVHADDRDNQQFGRDLARLLVDLGAPEPSPDGHDDHWHDRARAWVQGTGRGGSYLRGLRSAVHLLAHGHPGAAEPLGLAFALGQIRAGQS